MYQISAFLFGSHIVSTTEVNICTQSLLSASFTIEINYINRLENNWLTKNQQEAKSIYATHNKLQHS